MALSWQVTNYREQHLKENGRILGKIIQHPSALGTWDCRAGRVYLGSRKNIDSARALVERGAARVEEKERERELPFESNADVITKIHQRLFKLERELAEMHRKAVKKDR